MSRTIKKVAVLGSGVRGSAIAAALAGYKILMLDIMPFDSLDTNVEGMPREEEKAKRNTKETRNILFAVPLAEVLKDGLLKFSVLRNEETVEQERHLGERHSELHSEQHRSSRHLPDDTLNTLRDALHRQGQHARKRADGIITLEDSMQDLGPRRIQHNEPRCKVVGLQHVPAQSDQQLDQITPFLKQGNQRGAARQDECGLKFVKTSSINLKLLLKPIKGWLAKAGSGGGLLVVSSLLAFTIYLLYKLASSN